MRKRTACYLRHFRQLCGYVRALGSCARASSGETAAAGQAEGLGRAGRAFALKRANEVGARKCWGAQARRGCNGAGRVVLSLCPCRRSGIPTGYKNCPFHRVRP